MPEILIIDDDPGINEFLSAVVKRMGCNAHGALTAEAGLAAAHQRNFDVVLLDVNLPDGNGLQILSQIRQHPDAPEVIIITANGDPDAAEMAIKNGAWDYLLKPTSTGNVQLTIQRALAYRHEKCTAPAPKVLKRDDIVGVSTDLNAVLERVAQAAAVDANVLICGETGTGKELFARAIHDNSARAKKRFVTVDCAALPDTLVESVLFGHSKGAFTGAEKNREGLVRQADGGSLFLDEVGELPLSVQKAFLRVIQEKRFRPVGGREEVAVDFRLIAATHRNLDEMVHKGLFRNDLLFRLRSFPVEAPALRRRPEDIRSLADYHISRLCHIYGSENKGFSGDFLEALQQYQWPGNVRELFHTLEAAIAIAGSESTLYPHHLPIHLRALLTRMSVKASTTSQAPPLLNNLATMDKASFIKINDFREMTDRRYLGRLMQLTHGNRKEACHISGLSRTRLFELLKKHNLAKPHNGRGPIVPSLK
ncbi:MAG: sigma-54-dependent Fis family transcriptional regulator [Desulfatitalea sp.]|nr:sigma-54 dependent transcriptional regulator [Desulfatitalea sp.]NNJ99151.1 sigma-54-dependent Fis family transcriptional regulator [Desulfatitalea sp.]